MGATKVIVTHRGALEAKYGAKAERVFRAVEGLRAADAARGLETRLVALDRRADMAEFEVSPMGTQSRGEAAMRGAKRCVDAIDAKLEPDYILILGGPDVVPMQSLANPAGVLAEAGVGGDDDPDVPSDLPYACDGEFQDHPGYFIGATRIVGRLPDVPGAASPDYLVKVLRLAAESKPLPREAYADWMGLSARAWSESTTNSVRELFGDTSRLVFSPPKTDRWSPEALAPRLHFINCHGRNCDIAYLGDSGRSGDDREWVALTAPTLRGKVTPGTVVAAECCWGGKVFSPRKSDGAEVHGRLGIPLEYLRQGAYGFFGSTTVAYGPNPEEPRVKNDYADLVCRIFLQKVLEGASLGRAALEARLGYFKLDEWHDPLKLKTLAQFYLLGDPSIHPVETGASAGERAVRVPVAVQRQAAEERAMRHAQLRREGRQITRTRARLEKLDMALSSEDERRIREALPTGVRAKLPAIYALAADVEEAARGVAPPRARGRANQVVLLLDRVGRELRGEDDPEPGEVRRVPAYGGCVAFIRDGEIVRIKKVVSR